MSRFVLVHSSRTAPTCVCIASATNNFRRCPMITEDGNVSSKSLARPLTPCVRTETVPSIIGRCRFESGEGRYRAAGWATAGHATSGLTGGVTTDVGSSRHRLRLGRSAGEGLIHISAAMCATCRLQIRRTAGKEARRGRERRDDARRRAMRATRDGATRDARDGATRDGGERGEDDVR